MKIGSTDRKANKWVSERIGINDEDATVGKIKEKDGKYIHRKWRLESTIMASVEGERMGKIREEEEGQPGYIIERCRGMSLARSNAWKYDIYFFD